MDGQTAQAAMLGPFFVVPVWFSLADTGPYTIVWECAEFVGLHCFWPFTATTFRLRGKLRSNHVLMGETNPFRERKLIETNAD